MDEKTVRALNAINRSFYSEHAAEFSATRADPWPGWKRLPPLVRRHLAGRNLRVLDVGCGNGRFPAYLVEALPEMGESLHYCGIDSSEALIALLRDRNLPFARVETLCSDLVEVPLETNLPLRSFDLVAVFGLLHHVPGERLRRDLLRGLAGALAPGGLLLLATWRFEDFARFRLRVLPWEDWDAGPSEPLEIAELEAGDHLLRWGEGARSVRYCHFADDAEVGRWLEPLPLEEIARYDADGREQRLNRYFVLRRGEEA